MPVDKPPSYSSTATSNQLPSTEFDSNSSHSTSPPEYVQVTAPPPAYRSSPRIARNMGPFGIQEEDPMVWGNELDRISNSITRSAIYQIIMKEPQKPMTIEKKIKSGAYLLAVVIFIIICAYLFSNTSSGSKKGSHQPTEDYETDDDFIQFST
ncbi:hypothetical protein DASC09_004340 [Saccharomycopsis crataegensis]|uniref:Uncharacterized protein n=1 Tax=Saccharomycopsis crataegensis TaxID=43959 RepID=A0AAV5QEM2_9ASCO|nr:hypothetical protein DASC09_004340 [Saccharomycopsis crataegensis]